LTPDNRELLNETAWATTGKKELVTMKAPTGELPFNVAIHWRTEDGVDATVNLPVNVTDPARLPPPEELRTLPVDAVLRALASLRPLHEAVVDAIRRRERATGNGHGAEELDPLRRFSPTGQLLYRTRELSAALVGLRERLERPAASFDAFRWRLDGVFGPLEIADGLIEERRANRAIVGEEPFMLAEIGLTLANVDLERTSRFIPDDLPRMRRAIRAATRALASKCAGVASEPALKTYVDDAFRRALR
jgi:hypothetical protein